MRVALGGSTIKKITTRSGLTTPLHTRKDRSDMSIYSSRHAPRAVICIRVTAYGVCLLFNTPVAPMGLSVGQDAQPTTVCAGYGIPSMPTTSYYTRGEAVGKGKFTNTNQQPFSKRTVALLRRDNLPVFSAMRFLPYSLMFGIL